MNTQLSLLNQVARNMDVRIDKLNIKGLITNEPFSGEAATARESGRCETITSHFPH